MNTSPTIPAENSTDQKSKPLRPFKLSRSEGEKMWSPEEFDSKFIEPSVSPEFGGESTTAETAMDSIFEELVYRGIPELKAAEAARGIFGNKNVLSAILAAAKAGDGTVTLSHADLFQSSLLCLLTDLALLAGGREKLTLDDFNLVFDLALRQIGFEGVCHMNLREIAERNRRTAGVAEAYLKLIQDHLPLPKEEIVSRPAEVCDAISKTQKKTWAKRKADLHAPPKQPRIKSTRRVGRPSKGPVLEVGDNPRTRFRSLAAFSLDWVARGGSKSTARRRWDNSPPSPAA